MPITALPKATVHLLGSAQVLTTPTSLVKELIDNSLDAKATSIDILISRNTLDKLEVRDNGHGISSEDFNSLAKRGHTSKLSTFEELAFVGGATLGFRGEALASAAELGEVSVTTKTEGEAVGSKLVLKARGGVDQRTRTSHPVGTTVSVLKFMYKLPVRKKTFEKEAPKTLAKINQLLRSYALARPSIRFGLKVTDGGKGSWSFAPRPHDGIREAISLVIGRETAMECIEKSMISAENQPNTTVHSGDKDRDPGLNGNSHSKDGCFVIEAFLPKADADASQVETGQYLSIDSRPVSHEKGTMKKIVTLFKKYIRGALPDTSEKLKNPFIRLNIKCPIASYDANVEPAKDDVLFGNESIVLDLAENLLKEVYGDLGPAPAVSAPNSLPKKLDDFELLLAKARKPITEKSPPAPTPVSLARRSPSFSSPTLRASSPWTKEPSTAVQSSVAEMEENNNEQVGSDRRKWGYSMSSGFCVEADDSRQLGRSNTNVIPHPQQTPDREISGTPLNPWIIAKMTTPSSLNNATSESHCSLPRPLSEIIPSQQGSDQLSDSIALVTSGTQPRQTFGSDDIRALQPSVSRRYSASAICPEFDDERLIVDENTAFQPRRRNDFVSARNIPEDALVSPQSIQFSKAPPRARGPNRPFVSPLASIEHRVAPAGRLVQTTLFKSNPRPPRQSDGVQAIPQNELHQDLAWAMDFEQRKEDTTRRRRKEMRTAQIEAQYSSSSVPIRSSPHENRYNAAIASLEAAQPRVDVSSTSGQAKVPFKTTLPDGDPRAYLMKRQKSLTAKRNGPGDQPRMMRAKSTRLPLERIPQEEHLYNLVYSMPTDKEKLPNAVEILAKEDLYVRCGVQSAGLIINAAETPLVLRRIQEAVKQWIGSGDGNKYEIEYNFGNLLNSKSLRA